jgi:hypothetical protein
MVGPEDRVVVKQQQPHLAWNLRWRSSYLVRSARPSSAAGDGATRPERHRCGQRASPVCCRLRTRQPIWRSRG